ncbi:MAG: zinc metalloprotease HtpX [Candidatus Diapherotrites archaeon]
MGQQLKTVFFLGLMTGIFLLTGYVIGGEFGIIIAFVLALFMNLISYWFSDKIVLKMYRAKEISRNENPELHSMIEMLAQQFEVPKPKVYLVENPSPNAFATGRNPANAAIAVTTGLLKLLNTEELRGVLAHEFAHIKNRDILISTVAAVIAGAIGMLAFFARIAMWGGSSRDRGNIVSLILVAIMIPIIAVIVRLAISRSREYLADETAAKTIHSHIGLANALQKLQYGTKKIPMHNANEGTAHMFIANPFGKTGFMELFSTHPPMEKRIERLRNVSM